MPDADEPKPLCQAVRPNAQQVCNPHALAGYGGLRADRPALILLAAGRGTRFGQLPKCVQPVCDLPLARHSIDAFRAFSEAPVICIVGYRQDEVMAAFGDDNVYVRSDNPTGGTAYAALEAIQRPGAGADQSDLDHHDGRPCRHMLGLPQAV